MTVDLATSTPSFFEAAFAAIARRVRTARDRRARQIALINLMDMDANQLDDLGLSAGDVMDALAERWPAGNLLEARRARRATQRP